MKRLTKVLLTSLLTIIMVVGFSATAFASTHNVTVHIIQRDSTVSPVVDTYFTELPGGTIVLTGVNSNTILKNVVNTALSQQATASGTSFSASWTYVPESQYNDAYEYLGGMTLGGTPYNGGYTIQNYGTNQHLYTGTSWVWNYSGNTNDYPSDYMDQTTIGEHEHLWLIYETSSFVY